MYVLFLADLCTKPVSGFSSSIGLKFLFSIFWLTIHGRMSFFLLNNLYDKNYRHFCNMYPKNPSQFPSQPHNKKAAKLVEKGDLWQIYTPIPPAIHTVRKQECSLKNIYYVTVLFLNQYFTEVIVHLCSVFLLRRPIG